MEATKASETTIPLLPCHALDETLTFYGALGFAVTYEQREPYLYAAVQQGGVQLHFAKLTVYGKRKAFGASLVFVPDVAVYHARYADGLRTHYGKVPTAELPRITRLYEGHTRFTLFDPSGNMLTYINQDEPDIDYAAYEVEMSPMARALDTACFLRDTYANDRGAARVLDLALVRHKAAAPLERARVLAARAELAVAMGELEMAHKLRAELQQVPLSHDEREQYRAELEAAERLERWL